MIVQKFDNFLDADLYELVLQEATRQYNENSNLRVNVNWKDNIKKDSFPVLTYTLDKNTELFFRLKETIINRTNMFPHRDFIMFYYWSSLSYIPWHADGRADDNDFWGYDSAITVYLNREWDRDWGGYFMYEDGDEIKAILPKANLAVLQSYINHTTTTVNLAADTRMTLQVFLTKEQI